MSPTDHDGANSAQIADRTLTIALTIPRKVNPSCEFLQAGDVRLDRARAVLVVVRAPSHA